MDPDFWHTRWENGEIGFHQHDYNAHMQQFVERLGVKHGNHVFVPLCGKSLDMLWLENQGLKVDGVEISPLAVESFFAENDRHVYTTDTDYGFTAHDGDITIHCTDFFDLDPRDLVRVDAVYDRASLIALPAEMRERYVRHLQGFMPTGTRSLLITLDYPQAEMDGPPFSVTPEEVTALFATAYTIEQVYSEDCLAAEPRFRERGLSRLEEHVFLLTRKG